MGDTALAVVTSSKSYPKRSQLRRAEARATRSGDRRARSGAAGPALAAARRVAEETCPITTVLPRGARSMYRRNTPMGPPTAPGGLSVISIYEQQELPAPVEPSTPATGLLRRVPSARVGEPDVADLFTPHTSTTPFPAGRARSRGTGRRRSGGLQAPPPPLPGPGPGGAVGVVPGWDPAAWNPEVDPAAARRGRRRSAGGAPSVDRSRHRPPASGSAPVGRGKVGAARLLVLTLVVGIEGLTVSQLTHPAHSSPADAIDSAGASGAMALLAGTDSTQADTVLADSAQRQQSAVLSQRQAVQAQAAQVSSVAPKLAASLAQARAAAEAAAARVAEVAQARTRAVRNSQSSPQDLARLMLADRGWSSQFGCLDRLWTRESGWNYRATNPSSGAYGIPQALPGSKMSTIAPDWRTNPVTQMKWGLNYIADRYGTPCGAWGHSQAYGWY